ncbi:ribulokinase [Tropicimonas sp. IMCC6043]|uniref:ribulokinase n=1 Tax=Tropicimonas sp. IMCC6043 TaxID=2510645 RepID=UPI00101CE79F|nr:ribulokinase [Tropicimonas sp. IMCC6043]RYH10384.1 ribulokinase [Tropicimonas sp. IMCC6043]
MQATSNTHVLGLDFGSDSVRAVVVRATDGAEIASGVAEYPRWMEGRFCNPARQQYRQHPADYMEAMVAAVRDAIAGCDGTPEIVGIGVDTTGSSPLPVADDGAALALKEGFTTDPDAMCILWKDHTSTREAEEINALCAEEGVTDYIRYVGGIYSSEWYWAKILNVGRSNSKVFRAAANWVELCDYIPALLTGVDSASKVVRSRCAAGHKALWHPDWGGLPDRDWLTRLDPVLGNLTTPLFTETRTSDQVAGMLTPEWAGRFGIPSGIPVAVGAFDCHMGAVGAGIEPYSLVRVMGTSTCDILVAPPEEVGDTLVHGICGQVPGSVMPGQIGFEAGQSSFGDVFAWFESLLSWGRSERGSKGSLLPALEKEAAALPPGAFGERALDWLNGRRTPDADQTVRAMIGGLHLGSTAPSVYRALVEATAFGSRAIVERFESEGIPVKKIVAIGGIARKSDLISQVCADVMNREIHVVESDQACARGAAIFAATAAGAHDGIEAAKAAMLSPIEKTFTPNAEAHAAYEAIYADYQALGAFANANLKG